MGVIVRQSITNSIITYAGIGLGFILTIFLYPHILNPDQYGLTRVLISASYISSQLAHLGMHNLVMRYYPFFKKADSKSHGFLFWAITIPIIGFAIFTLLFFLADDLLIRFYEERSILFVEYYLWVLPLTLFILYYEVLNSYLRSLKDSVTGSLANEVTLRLIAITVLALYFFEWISFSQFIALFVLSYITQPLTICVRIWKMGEFRFIPNFKILKKPLYRGMINYSFYSLFGGLTTVLVWNIDVLMLGSMAGLDQTAIYAIAFYIASVITVPQRSIEKIAAPLLSGFIKEKNWEQVGAIYRKTSLNQLIPGFLIFGFIWIHIDTLFLLLPEIYSAGKWVILIVGIGKLVEMGTGANGIILINSKHYRVSFYTNIVLVVITILLNYLLIPHYGIEGAAIASAFAIFVFNSVKCLFIKLRFGLQPFTYQSLVVVVLGSVTLILVSNWVEIHSLWFDIPIKTILFGSLYLLPILYYRISPDLNDLLQSIRQKWKS
ncbi:MAG: polysaccharide biosynthesis C-terminal domain-containing protein [Balneolaceae bacterium]